MAVIATPGRVAQGETSKLESKSVCVYVCV